MQRPAYVVVDAGAIRRAVGAPLDPDVVVDPDRVRQALQTCGLDVLDVTVVSADAPLPGTPPSLVAHTDDLADAQLERLIACGTPSRHLSAFLGRFAQPEGFVTGELAVDGLLVAASLQYAREIGDGRRPEGVVVLLSDDPDVWICHRYPVEVPFVYAGSLDTAARSEIEHLGGRWLHLPSSALHELSGRAVAGLAGLVELETSPDAFGALRDGERLRRRLAASRWKGSESAATVAVVDLSDLFRNALASVGVARLPGPGEVRRVLERLRFPEPSAAYATVPDVPDELLPAPDDPASIGWRLRDAQFAEAGAAYSADEDVSTRVASGELIIERQLGGRYHVTGQRRLATSVVADAWWAATARPGSAVVVLSDRWDLVALQWHAAELGITRPNRLVRAGTQASTIHDLELPHVVLPDDVLAELMRVETPQRAAATVGMAGWCVEDVSLSQRTATLLSVGGSADPSRVRHDRFEERVVATALVAGGDDLDEPGPAEVRRARVIGYQEPAAVILESPTGDRVTVAASGGRQPRPGEVVSLVTDGTGARWFVGPPVDPTARGTEAVDPTLLVVVDVEERLSARPSASGEPGPLRPLPGTALAVGDRLLGVPDRGGWQAISTRLVHLPDGGR